MASKWFTFLRFSAIALTLSLVPFAADAADAPAGGAAKPAKAATAAKAQKSPKPRKAAEQAAPAQDAGKGPGSQLDQDLRELEAKMRAPKNLRRPDGGLKIDPAVRQPRHGDGSTPDTPREMP